MIKTLVHVFALLLHVSFFVQAQTYIPLDFQRAYENGTRSYNGSPGKKYWQNHSTYVIDVQVIPGTWEVRGQARISYFNESPDTLDRLIVRTYPDHYKLGAARDTPVRRVNLTEGMHIASLQVRKEIYDVSDQDQVKVRNTYIEISLVEQLAPGTSLDLEVSWSFVLPLEYKNRIGAYDSTSAFIGYWYPQIGVYDDLSGWDKNQYLGRQEFYRDFADFQVNIEVPEDFNVWATGERNKNETDRQFTATNVQDFAFAVSRDFVWEEHKITLGVKKVRSAIVYPAEDSTTLKNVLDQQDAAIEFYSEQFPGVTYPYSAFTTFWGVPEYDGMEFPMIANNGSAKSKWHYDLNQSITVHELAHTYFPFYVGVNEVKHSWMEEGWAVFLEASHLDYLNKNKDRQARITKYYSGAAGSHWESPLFVPSNQLVNGRDHSQNAYLKSAVLYFQLQDLLGKRLFKEATQAYIGRWAGKHPTPFDWMFTLEDVSGMDLGWFWDSWIFKHGYPDLALNRKNDKIWVENKGTLPLSFEVEIVDRSGNKQVEVVKASQWRESNRWELPIRNLKSIATVTLMETTPDVDTSNNRLEL